MKGKVKQIVKELEALRTQKSGGIDISIQAYVEDKYKTEMAKFFHDLGINPMRMSITQVLDLDDDTRWIVPEIIREAIRKGMRRSPWYSKIIAKEESIAQPTITMPYFNLSDAEVQAIRQGETIPVGTVSYGSKQVAIEKAGIGILVTYEAMQYSSISLVSIFLEDIGVKLGLKLNRMAALTLINGDQATGAESAAVIGVNNTSSKLQYTDELAAHIRGALLGRTYNSVLANETELNHLLNLAEHKQPYAGAVLQKVNVDTPLPSEINAYAEGSIPDNQFVYVDPIYALIQLTSQALMVESEKIISKQISGTYATVQTGFANLLRDARLIIDQSKAFSSNGFPSWMNPAE